MEKNQMLPTIPPTTKRPWWKIIIITIIVIIIVIWAGDKIIGGDREKPIPIPSFLQGAQIKFENQMYYRKTDPYPSSKTFKSVGTQIIDKKTLGTYTQNISDYKLVSTTTMFSIIGAINNANYGLSAIDSGTKGVDYLILQDEQGNKSLIALISLVWSGSTEEALNASYYRDGKRVDFIRSSDLPRIFGE